MDLLTQARDRLLAGGHRCVMLSGGDCRVSDARGVRPLLDALAEGCDLRDYVVADRVIGKAAAMLLVLAGVRQAHGLVVSQTAINFARENSLCLSFDRKVDVIADASGTGICPLEQAVADIEDVAMAHAVIVATIRELRRRAQQGD
ncbi:MAG: DUF1893 domain-containing protein [Oligosphaeraceae bacterium]